MVREILKVIIHCSDSPDNREIGLIEIDSWHKERFAGVIVDGSPIYCGYHYIIRRDGVIEVGRPESVIGAHCEGQNKNSIGICWIGRSQISPEQSGVLINLTRNILLRYALTSRQVFGHREFNPAKTCPNIDMDWVRETLRVIVGE